jgi:hypothetical protein
MGDSDSTMTILSYSTEYSSDNTGDFSKLFSDLSMDITIIICHILLLSFSGHNPDLHPTYYHVLSRKVPARSFAESSMFPRLFTYYSSVYKTLFLKISHSREQSVSTRHGEVLGMGLTPAPPRLGYEEMGG